MQTKVFEPLAFAYPNQNIPAGTWKLYASMFKDVDDATMARAILKWIEAEDWFPKIKDLRHMVETVGYDKALTLENQPWYVQQSMSVTQIDALLWDVEAKRDPLWGKYCTDESRAKLSPSSI
jgi:hypothetical protein